MENIKEFLNTHYENAIRLKERFKTTEPTEWTPLIVICELSVQYGHLINTIHHNAYLEERGRNIVNTNDEISDVLLQLSYLSYLENINIDNIDKYKNEDIDIEYAIILLGQLTEAIMEKENYRYSKERIGFNNIDEFIEDRIFRLFTIIGNFAKKNMINIIKEFDLMLDDANNFLDNYVQKKYIFSKH